MGTIDMISTYLPVDLNMGVILGEKLLEFRNPDIPEDEYIRSIGISAFNAICDLTRYGAKGFDQVDVLDTIGILDSQIGQLLVAAAQRDCHDAADTFSEEIFAIAKTTFENHDKKHVTFLDIVKSFGQSSAKAMAVKFEESPSSIEMMKSFVKALNESLPGIEVLYGEYFDSLISCMSVSPSEECTNNFASDLSEFFGALEVNHKFDPELRA
eukprot:GDKJ01041498.1.p1 GENE.GDKJ01041498.1~~GDKJ01041498.1.p1  ORF type:complete len:212 (+),score=48.45 GDKJ01041498.1:1-636(+)